MICGRFPPGLTPALAKSPCRESRQGLGIMPGKVNPVIPEAVNQVAFQIIANDAAITLAAMSGQNAGA